MKKIIATVICAFALFTLVHKTDTIKNSTVSPKIQYMMTDPGGL